MLRTNVHQQLLQQLSIGVLARVQLVDQHGRPSNAEVQVRRLPSAGAPIEYRTPPRVDREAGPWRPLPNPSPNAEGLWLLTPAPGRRAESDVWTGYRYPSPSSGAMHGGYQQPPPPPSLPSSNELERSVSPDAVDHHRIGRWAREVGHTPGPESPKFTALSPTGSPRRQQSRMGSVSVASIRSRQEDVEDTRGVLRTRAAMLREYLRANCPDGRGGISYEVAADELSTSQRPVSETEVKRAARDGVVTSLWLARRLDEIGDFGFRTDFDADRATTSSDRSDRQRSKPLLKRS